MSDGADDRVAILQGYAEGRIGYRAAIDRLGMEGFADLLVAVSQAGLSLPRVSAGPENVAHLVAILRDRLR